MRESYERFTAMNYWAYCVLCKRLSIKNQLQAGPVCKLLIEVFCAYSPFRHFLGCPPPFWLHIKSVCLDNSGPGSRWNVRFECCSKQHSRQGGQVPYIYSLRSSRDATKSKAQAIPTHSVFRIAIISGLLSPFVYTSGQSVSPNESQFMICVL